MCKALPVYPLYIAVPNLYSPSTYFFQRRKKKKEGRMERKKPRISMEI
jgi:hypothetical protein